MAIAGSIRVDFLRPEDLSVPGRLGLTIAPGRWRPDGPASPLQADLRELRQVHRASVLVTLMEEFELKRYGMSLSQLRAAVRKARLESIWFPIADLGVPSLEDAVPFVKKLAKRLAAPKTVVVHCFGGLGRSGTVAACVLVAHGREAGDAIERVRAVRPGSVQSPLQEAFVKRFEDAWRERPAGS